MLTVMKFGGSSVADLEHIRNVANRCIAKQREGSQVVDFHGRQCSVTECMAGSNAYNFKLSECTIQEN